MRIVLLPIRFILFFFSCLPFRLLYLMADLLYFFLYTLLGYRKSVVRDNLKKAFPELAPEALKTLEKQAYANLCQVIVEFIKIPSLSAKQLSRRVIFTNPGLLNNMAETGKPTVAVTSHLCNWEWGGLALSQLATRFDCLGVYKPLHNEVFDRWFRQLRSRFGMEMVPMRNTYRAFKTPRTKPVLLTLIADQTPTRSQTEYVASFMGRPTPVYLGPEKLGGLTGTQVIYFAMRRLKKGFYTVTIIPFPELPAGASGLPESYPITHWHLAWLESEIQQNPGNWLWSHRRWKHSDAFAAAGVWGKV